MQSARSLVLNASMVALSVWACLGLGERFRIGQALEDAEWKTNFKSDGPTWNGQ